VYPDGTPRPPVAWSGILAFLTWQRSPAIPAPDKNRERGELPEFEDEAKTEEVAEPVPEDAKPKNTPIGPVLSWRYPLTEILSIVLMIITVNAALTEPRMSLLQLVFWMIYIAIFVLIIVIDIEHKLILFVVVIPTALLALLNVIITPQTATAMNLTNALMGAVMGFVPFFIFFYGGVLLIYVIDVIRGKPTNTVAFGVVYHGIPGRIWRSYLHRASTACSGSL
jgi:hypothetical protein